MRWYTEKKESVCLWCLMVWEIQCRQTDSPKDNKFPLSGRTSRYISHPGTWVLQTTKYPSFAPESDPFWINLRGWCCPRNNCHTVRPTKVHHRHIWTRRQKQDCLHSTLCSNVTARFSSAAPNVFCLRLHLGVSANFPVFNPPWKEVLWIIVSFRSWFS